MTTMMTRRGFLAVVAFAGSALLLGGCSGGGANTVTNANVSTNTNTNVNTNSNANANTGVTTDPKLAQTFRDRLAQIKSDAAQDKRFGSTTMDMISATNDELDSYYGLVDDIVDVLEGQFGKTGIREEQQAWLDAAKAKAERQAGSGSMSALDIASSLMSQLDARIEELLSLME